MTVDSKECHPRISWQRATLIATLLNLAFFLVALLAEPGAWGAAWEDPLFTIIFSMLPHALSGTLAYIMADLLSRSKAAPPILAPAVFVVLGILLYGLVIFGGPGDPDTAGQMAVFFDAGFECVLLFFALIILGLACGMRRLVRDGERWRLSR